MVQIGVYASKVGSKGVVGEYQYKGEPYDLARQAELVSPYKTQFRNRHQTSKQQQYAAS